MAALGQQIRSTMKIEDMVFERVMDVGADNLTDVERCYWLIWQLEAQANNGGLETFLENSLSLSVETIEALNKVKAFKMASLLKEAVDCYKAAPKNIESNKIRIISNRFTDYPENLGALLDSFISLNKSALLGPKNELELWEGRKKRGQNAPRFLTKEIDYEKEAMEDEKYSSRNCPECSQPVPDYRKTCKKCGYPVGRRTQP